MTILLLQPYFGAEVLEVMKDTVKNLKIIKTGFATALAVASIHPAHSQAVVKYNCKYMTSGTPPFMVVVDFTTRAVHDGPNLIYVDGRARFGGRCMDTVTFTSQQIRFGMTCNDGTYVTTIIESPSGIYRYITSDVSITAECHNVR
jgi:hypothetical protein